MIIPKDFLPVHIAIEIVGIPLILVHATAVQLRRYGYILLPAHTRTPPAHRDQPQRIQWCVRVMFPRQAKNHMIGQALILAVRKLRGDVDPLAGHILDHFAAVFLHLPDGDIRVIIVIALEVIDMNRPGFL